MFLEHRSIQTFFLAFSLLAVIFLVSQTAFAQSEEETTSVIQNLSQPCMDCGSCTFEDFLIVFKNMANLGLSLIGPLLVLILIVAGLVFLFSHGNQELVDRGKKIISGALVGMTIVLSAWLIINTIVTISVKNQKILGTNWFSYNTVANPLACPKLEKLADIDPSIDLKTTTEYNWPGLSCILASTKPSKDFLQAPNSNPKNFCAASSLPGETCYCIITAKSPTCQNPAASDPCRPENLAQSKYFNNLLTATMASRICSSESSGNANKESASDICQGEGRGSKKPFSIGLFQINLTQHEIKTPTGTLNCPAAFGIVDRLHKLGRWLTFQKAYNCKVTDETLYAKCVAAAKNPDVNIKKALELSKKGTFWQDWSTNQNDNKKQSVCGFPSSKLDAWGQHTTFSK